jgi:hypothetical protein
MTSKPLARAISALSPTCKQAARLQSEAVHRKLSGWERAGLRFHLLICAWCRKYADNVDFIRSHEGSTHAEAPPPVILSDNARRRIQAKLRSPDNEG